MMKEVTHCITPGYRDVVCGRKRTNGCGQSPQLGAMATLRYSPLCEELVHLIVRRVIEDPRELAQLSPEWRELMTRSQIDELALTPTWVLSWWEIFGGALGGELRAVTFRDDGKLVGLAPLYRRRVKHGGVLPAWRLALCGSGEAASEEICSPYLGILAERGRETAVAESLAGALAAGELGAWDELVLAALSESDALLKPLETALGRAAMQPELEQVDQSAFMRLPKSWEAYLASLQGQRRYFVKRTLRDLEAWFGNAGGERRVTSHDELARGQAILYDLHRERWRAEGSDGVFDAPRFKRFHETVMKAFLDKTDAELELCWLEHEGRPFAVLYSFIYKGRVHFYQSGRSLDVPKTVRPGIGAHLFAIKRHIEAGRDVYDFLEGEQMYKSQLSSEERQLFRMRALSPALRSRALEEARKALLVGRKHAREIYARIRSKAAPG
jgi:CelD/BcsL family acetyltransferase involved in cellulose biosynthesis